MTAADVLKRMAEAYATARTYSDTGLVHTLFIKDSGRHENDKPFSTTFERPRWFRFHYDDRIGGRAWVLCRDEATSTFLHLGRERRGPLEESIAALTGVSGGSAYRVPSLLMPDVLKSDLVTGLQDPALNGQESVNGEPCYSLTGRTPRADVEGTIWIGSNDFLIRRILERKSIGPVEHERALEFLRGRGHRPLPRFEDFTAETTTTYQPVKDEPILRGEFDSR